MKKVLAVFSVVAAIAAASFAGAAKADVSGVTASATSSSVTVRGHESSAACEFGSGWVGISVYDDATAGTVFSQYVHATPDGNRNFNVTFPNANPFVDFEPGSTITPNTAYVYVVRDHCNFVGDPRRIVTSNLSAPRGPDGIFLCYSKFQTDPGVFGADVAGGLLDKGGYWLPWALKGNAGGGTNIGAYHLICNLAAGQKSTGGYVDADGASEDAQFSDVLGIYPTAG